jgi:phage tail sheath protein FI
VKCDAGLNDSSAQDEGKVYMEIGVALVKPAEFIILKIGQQRLSA